MGRQENEMKRMGKKREKRTTGWQT